MDRLTAAALALLLLSAPVALAGPATVEAVSVERAADGTLRFDVTVRHADTGWEHYANAFVVREPDGTVLGTRTLHHPHVEEQPFTRSLTGVLVPDGVRQVEVIAVDSVHGEGEPVAVDLSEALSR